MVDKQGNQPKKVNAATPNLVVPPKEHRNYIAVTEKTKNNLQPEPTTGDSQDQTSQPLRTVVPPPSQRVYLNTDKKETSQQDTTEKNENKALDSLEETSLISDIPKIKPEEKLNNSGHNSDNRQSQPEPPNRVLASKDNGDALNKRHATANLNRELRALAKNGKYKLEQMIARGAESVLYKASCNGKLVCVKAVRNALNRWVGDAMTRNQEERLEKVNYRTKLRHIRNEFRVSEIYYSDEEIPAVHIYALRPVNFLGLEVGYDLIMEYLPGHDLGDKILARTLTLADKVNVFYRAVKSVSFLHKRNLIHLDIKPSNFMLVRDQVKLIDFGVSVGVGYRPRAITGTAGYLSPEQICREPLDEGTDIFALGVAFSVFFGGRTLNQSQDNLLRRQTRIDAQYHLTTDTQPMINEAPDLHSLPQIFEILRNCTIPKREARINKCETLLILLRQKAEQAGIELID